MGNVCISSFDLVFTNVVKHTTDLWHNYVRTYDYKVSNSNNSIDGFYFEHNRMKQLSMPYQVFNTMEQTELLVLDKSALYSHDKFITHV